ncbi:MAG: DsbA family oxidoreductase, partial [archaeon]|nr:DsbA family oxidoreductase [archaeon]
EARIKKALDQLGLTENTKIVFKAFRLNPNAPKEPKRNMVEGFSHHYRISLDAARAQVERIEAMGRGEGLVFNYATARNSNTMDALRLAKLAQTKGNDFGNRFVERMYKAYFEENLVLADHGVLRKISSEMGLSPEEVENVLGSNAFREDVEREEYEAHSLGINAVPFFAINRAYGIPGAVDIRDMKQILEHAFNEEEAESVENGMVCGPDGCRPADE